MRGQGGSVGFKMRRHLPNICCAAPGPRGSLVGRPAARRCRRCRNAAAQRNEMKRAYATLNFGWRAGAGRPCPPAGISRRRGGAARACHVVSSFIRGRGGRKTGAARRGAERLSAVARRAGAAWGG